MSTNMAARIEMITCEDVEKSRLAAGLWKKISGSRTAVPIATIICMETKMAIRVFLDRARVDPVTLRKIASTSASD
jgi:hypothetical protein